MSLTDINTINVFCKDVIGNVRTAQEDSHDIAALTPNGDVFVVCDGMGGHVGGKHASTIAVKSIIDYLKKEKYPQPIQALNEALQFANMQILGYANEHPELKGMGTTACIVLLQDSEAYIAHVGDSRIYLYLGKEKELHRITKDHSYVQTLVDAGQITDEEAEHHPNKNRILKALGIKPELAPSFNRVLPKNGDVFLICSDGLSGMIPDSTIKDVLVQNTSIEHKGEILVTLALEAGGLDNITLELIQITKSPHSKSAFKSYNPTSNNKAPKGISKIINQLIIASFVVIICFAIGYGIYCRYRLVVLEREFNELNEKISEDSIELVKMEKVLADFESNANKMQDWEHDIDELNNEYKSKNKASSERNKDAIESHHKIRNGLQESLDKKRVRRQEILEKLNTKRRKR